jgi:DNA repair protein RadC
MPKSRQKISELPEDDRPTEKLLKKGVSFLSDSEVLGILLRFFRLSCGSPSLKKRG